MLDTLSISKNTKDLFWPVGVVTGKLLAVTLKGGEEHPSAYPRPVLTGACGAVAFFIWGLAPKGVYNPPPPCFVDRRG